MTGWQPLAIALTIKAIARNNQFVFMPTPLSSQPGKNSITVNLNGITKVTVLERTSPPIAKLELVDQP